MQELAGSIILALVATSCMLWWRVVRESDRETALMQVISERPGSLRLSGGRRFAPDLLLVLIGLILFYVFPLVAIMLLAGGLPTPESSDRATPLFGSVVGHGVLVPLLFVVLRLLGQPLTVRGGRTVVDIVQISGRGLVLSVAPVGMVLLATSHLRSEETQHTLLKMLSNSPDFQVVGLILLLAVVSAPVTEELLFRCLLQTHLEQHVEPRVAILIASLIFSFVHGFPDSIALIPLAIVLGTVWYRTRCYACIVMIHALFNLANVGLMMMQLPTG